MNELRDPPWPASMMPAPPPRAAEQPAPDFNAASSWAAMTLRERWRVCKLAGFAAPFDVADKRFSQLTDAEKDLLRETVRAQLFKVPPSAWGLAS